MPLARNLLCRLGRTAQNHEAILSRPHIHVRHLIIAHRSCKSCGRCLGGRGRADEQVQREGNRHLSTGALPIGSSSPRSHDRRTERCAEEASCCCPIRCFSKSCRSCPCATSAVQQLPLRWTTVLLSNEVLRRSKVLPRQLPWHQDGWRQERNSLREAMVLPLALVHRSLHSDALTRTDELRSAI